MRLEHCFHNCFTERASVCRTAQERARMGEHSVSRAAAIAAMLVAVASPPVGAQSPGAPPGKSSSSSWTPPRTPWGDPDLQGTYTNKDESGIPMEKPDGLSTRNTEQL